MYTGVYYPINNDEPICLKKYYKMKDIINPFTIIGACIEKDLVFIGQENYNQMQINERFPKDLIEISVFDCLPPRGDIFVIKTDIDGNFVNCALKDLKQKQV